MIVLTFLLEGNFYVWSIQNNRVLIFLFNGRVTGLLHGKSGS